MTYDELRERAKPTCDWFLDKRAEHCCPYCCSYCLADAAKREEEHGNTVEWE